MIFQLRSDLWRFPGSAECSPSLLPKQDIHDIPHVLFIGHGLRCLRRETDQLPAVLREFCEEGYPGTCIEIVPPQQRVQQHCRLRGRDPLPQPRFQVGKLPQGIELSHRKLV